MTNTNIQQAQFVEHTLQPIGSSPTAKSPPGTRQRANDLDGKTWTKYSISIWSDLAKTPEELALVHPAMFPLALVKRLIAIFTNEQQTTILDPFAGVGSTVLAAKHLGKHGIGIELSPDYVALASMRCEQSLLFEQATGQATMYHGNALQLLDYVGEQTVDLVVTSPPYWDILNQKRTADNKATRHYGNNAGDLGTIGDYQAFLDQLRCVFEQVYTTLRPGGYCCVIVMDLRKKDVFYPLHSDIATFMQAIGFIYDDLIIWDRRHEYNNMRPLGYPAVFRVNKAHEFIIIFQKPKVKKT
jgi:DNA modification methylase